MVEYLLRCGLAPSQPRPSIETLLHAFIPAAHVDHTHPDAIIALTSSPDGRSLAEEAFGDRSCLAGLPTAGLRHVEADRGAARGEPVGTRGPAREARPRHVGRDARAELPRHDRVRDACRGRARPRRRRPVRPRRQQGRGARGRRCGSPPRADPPRAPRRAARRRGRRRARRRPKPPCRRIRILGSRARGEPDRRSVPRPPDPHEAQAARRGVRPRDRRRRRACRSPADRSRRVLALVPRLLRAKRRRGDRQIPDRPGRGHGSCFFPGIGIVTMRRRRGTGAHRPRSLPPRDRGPRCRGRGRRLPLPERERGVRDRVLAARAVQARAGAAARRARGPRGA